jgi:hypothetical protein
MPLIQFDFDRVSDKAFHVCNNIILHYVHEVYLMTVGNRRNDIWVPISQLQDINIWMINELSADISAWLAERLIKNIPLI